MTNHCFGVASRQLSKSATAHDSEPLAGFEFGFVDCVEGCVMSTPELDGANHTSMRRSYAKKSLTCDASTKQRTYLVHREAVWNMLCISPINNCVFRKEAIALKPRELRRAILRIDTISGMETTALALETIVGVSQHADFVAQFEALAFSGSMDLGNDSNSFVADRGGSEVVWSNALHNV
jgi:hypothetical protein